MQVRQTLRMTTIAVPAGVSTVVAAVAEERLSIQIMNIGTGFATAKTSPVSSGVAAGGTSAAGNIVTPGVGYPLEAAAAGAGHQGGSTPIYDGTGVSTDEWNVYSTNGTTVLVVEGS